MAKNTKASKRRLSLAAFFRKLWSRKDLLERFSSGPEARAEVLREFNLAPAHRKVLEKGCVRDIIGALAGVSAPNSTVVIDSSDVVTCGHAECEAFMSAVKKQG